MQYRLVQLYMYVRGAYNRLQCTKKQNFVYIL